MTVPEGLARVDHIVLLMLENRSFDNMCGWLYAPTNPPPFDKPPRGQPFDGVAGKNLSNPIPPGAPGWELEYVPVGVAGTPTTPTPDPGEAYGHVNVQIYGAYNPPDNICEPFQPPFNVPDNPPGAPPMNGFVLDYVNVLRASRKPFTYEQYKVIMDMYTPAQVPVISYLASAYAISDRYFCSVPTQTLPNRSFSLAAHSSGFTQNTPYTQWLQNDVYTIFNRITDAQRSDLTWRIYYDADDILSLTWLILPRIRRYLFSNFAHMDDFFEDARTGKLPSFCLIEPRMFTTSNRNDQHPPYNVLAGERLIYDVYQALSQGPAWDRTLLLINYDEHGGIYDHVPPPAAVPPDPNAPPGQFGFRFDRLGVRVPMVLVSPLIEPGTVFRAKDANGNELPLEHASIIKTVTERFGLESLTARDAAAPDLSQVLTRLQPRQDKPFIPEPPTTLAPAIIPESEPPGDLLKSAVEILAAHLHLPAPHITHAEHALDFLHATAGRIKDLP